MKEFNFEKELLSVQDELFRFAYKLTADREKAEDLLQDTLLKAMLHKESYNKILFADHGRVPYRGGGQEL